MGSLEDQLRRLKPTLGKAATADSTGQGLAPASGEDPPGKLSWTDGVTPLDERHKGRIEHARPQKVQPAQVAGKRSKGSVGKALTKGPATPLAETINAERLQVASPREVGKAAPAGKQADALGPYSPRPDGQLLALSEESHFKSPEAWVNAGQALQVAGGGGGRVLSVYVGIDFGTAYTKAAIRFADKVFAVDWSGLSNAAGSFFLPGEVSVMPDGAISVGRASGARQLCSGVKQPFLSPDPPAAAQEIATAFLAWVCRYARAWLFKNYRAMLQNRKVVWNLAVGCPTEAIEDTALVRTYLHVASAAWLLSRSDKAIARDTAARALTVASPDPATVQLDSVGVVPEFVAQIAGYACSAQRRPGLHFLVDVGAGTIDLAMFNVERDHRDPSRDHFPILERSVELLGTHFLMQQRNSACGGTLGWTDVGQVPSAADLGAKSPQWAAGVLAADDEFGRKVLSRIRRLILLTRGSRSPYSPVWQQGLPIFLAGGGAQCELYRAALDGACSACNVKPLMLPLQVSDQVEDAGIDAVDRHRLSVAYGLTADAALLARITASKDIPDLFLYSSEREVPTRDELYPK